MIGLDTNVLVRYIIQDDQEQSRKATVIIEQKCSVETPAFISVMALDLLIIILRI